jgi:8-oxo-dGTP diphosphatase
MVQQPNNQSTEKNPVGRFMVAVGAIIELGKTGKILLIRRTEDQDWQPGEWEIPYGRIDQFEEPTEGLRRELKEETGLGKINIHQVTNIWRIFRGPKKADNALIGITFRCSTTQETTILSHEHSEYRWVTPTQALELIKVSGIRSDVERYVNRETANFDHL